MSGSLLQTGSSSTESGCIVVDPQVTALITKHYKCQSINVEKQRNPNLIFAPFLYQFPTKNSEK